MPERLPSSKHWMSRAADSAGIPFAGRELRPHPFAGDDGAAPERLSRALERWEVAWRERAPEEVGHALSEVIESLRTDRVLIPLLAESGEVGLTSEGRVVDKTQELSVVTVAGPGGERVGVCCSSVGQMSAWRVDARPIPVEAIRVAGWALTEGVDYVVLDPRSDLPVILRQPALGALVTGEPYVAPWLDAEVVDAVEARSLWGSEGLVGVAVEPGWHLDAGVGPDIIARVWLAPGLDRVGLDRATQTLSAEWARSQVITQRVSGIRLQLEAAPAPN
jgi:hypothetical protein